MTVDKQKSTSNPNYRPTDRPTYDNRYYYNSLYIFSHLRGRLHHHAQQPQAAEHADEEARPADVPGPAGGEAADLVCGVVGEVGGWEGGWIDRSVSQSRCRVWVMSRETDGVESMDRSISIDRSTPYTYIPGKSPAAPPSCPPCLAAGAGAVAELRSHGYHG